MKTQKNIPRPSFSFLVQLRTVLLLLRNFKFLHTSYNGIQTARKSQYIYHRVLQFRRHHFSLKISSTFNPPFVVTYHFNLFSSFFFFFHTVSMYRIFFSVIQRTYIKFFKYIFFLKGDYYLLLKNERFNLIFIFVSFSYFNKAISFPKI